MKTSIATVSISGTLDEKLRAVADAGFAAVEIFEQDLLTYPGTAREVGQRVRDLGMEISLFQPFRDLEGLPEPHRGRAFDRMARKFAVMADLGTDLVLLCSNCSQLALPDRSAMVDDLHALGELAARHGMRVGYEALAWGRHVNDHRDAWSLVRDADHPNLGLILDSFHSLARRLPCASIGDIRPEKLFIVQIADAPLLDMDYLYWSRHFRNMPGQGDFPLAEFADAVLRTGYQGYWSLEIFNDRFRAAPTAEVALDGYRSLQLMHDLATRRRRSTSSSSAISATTLPPRATVDRVSFIEFAASDEEAESLGTMLTQLGFVPTARHRRKAVTRWTQGDINLIVNCDPDGFARNFDSLHGASVCAIGLCVADVDAAMRRAEGLRIPRFSQAVGPDELQIPSVRGVGGSLLYFIDSANEAAVWHKEFLPLDDAPAAPANRLLLQNVDHIAQTMRYEEFLSWLLYYVALFDVTKTPQIEIPDPLGLIQSQAVESTNKALRIALNGSMGAQTLTSRFVHHYMGAGVQHIAFRTPDIFTAATAARAGGLPILPIAPNYYDDISARFDLDATLIERMAANHILYDRDGEAEYFQFYSRAFAKRVFFEIVERRGYEAYGAANAVIRLAAQARFKNSVAP
jgi:4-hydroxyphenylpyruvate dioxygenase